MDMLILAPMIALAILFISVVTKLWQKSISTAIHVISVAIAIYCYPVCAPEYTLGVLLLGVLISMARGVVNTEKDRFVKRSTVIT